LPQSSPQVSHSARQLCCLSNRAFAIAATPETDDQDRRIVKENTRGIRSPVYEAGPYPAAHEGSGWFVDWYASFIEPQLAEHEKQLFVA
jgi:phenylpropionate dioxygenase-like ring-hydroxylating dioxygenase large terminal subunit